MLAGPATPHPLRCWYKRYRRDYNALQAIWHARLSQQTEAGVCIAWNKLSQATRVRVDDFVDDFIRSEDVQSVTSDNDGDFINEPERAGRCHDAAEAEDGAAAHTHGEVIDDWREAFSRWLSDRQHGGADGFDRGDRWNEAVRARFALTELWHDYAGSLDTEVG